MKSTRTSEKVVKRERLYSFNKIDENQIHQIGIELSEYFIDQFPLNCNFNEIVNGSVIDNEVTVNQPMFFVYYDYGYGILCQMIIDSSNNVYQIIPVGEQQNDSFYKF